MSTINKVESLELASVIKKQVEILASYEQNIPQIEIDIVKENIRKLYDSIASFHIIEKSTPVNIQVESIDDEINDLLDEASQMFEQEKEKQIIEQETVLEEQALEEKIEPEIPDEKTMAEVHEEIEVEEEIRLKAKGKNLMKEVEIEKPGPKANSKAELKVKLEPKETKKPLGEKTVYVLDVEPDEIDEDEEFKRSKIIKKPIKSLKAGIGINDKFMFINDLFEGNAKIYNKNIKKLDSLKNLQEALYLLGDMKDENLWDTNDNVFHQFKIYIERRFL
ncbi:MAG: hypothetical protein DRI86_02535 [Bacteroidetes bacterium]|nr:MAG: hypothetical protein DRI86_02535 [Bacteroidota bacterium]